MERRKSVRGRIFPVLTVLLCLMMQMSVFAASDYKIEQVFVNKPEITVYYRTPDPEQTPEAHLGGEALALQDLQIFADCGEGVEYYILLDISASIPGNRFLDIKESLKQFHRELRDEDSMILTTFGDAVVKVLFGAESHEEADGVIDSLVNNNQNTVLFEAIDTAADEIWQAGDSSEKHRMVIVISDGKDCADNTRSVESVEKTLTSRGIPLYTMAVENNEGDSESEISGYRGKFGALARNTGGLPWVISNEVNVYGGLAFIRENVMTSLRAKFAAASNEISNSNEDLVLKYSREGNMTETVSVLVARAQSDSVPPEIVSIESTEINSITVTYSETVLNADQTNNYSVKKDGKSIPVHQVTAAAEPNTYNLIFDTELYEGEYEISVAGVTDKTNEKNSLSNPTTVLKSTWPAPTPTPTPVPEEESVGDLILKWWPVVLTLVVIILIIVCVIIVKNVKKKRSILVVDGQEVEADHVEFKQHVMVKNSQPALPTRQIQLWIGNGTDQPKHMNVTIKGSCIIGRSQQCDVYCDDPMMSKQHFVLELAGNEIFITDLQSRNGTSVNGVTVKEHFRLQPRDEISAGNLRFRVDWTY